MTTKDEALRQAREALQAIKERGSWAKAELDKDIPTGEPVHPVSAALTWPLSTVGLAIDSIDAALSEKAEAVAVEQAIKKLHMLIMPVPAPEVTALEVCKVVSERAREVIAILEGTHPAQQPEAQAKCVRCDYPDCEKKCGEVSGYCHKAAQQPAPQPVEPDTVRRLWQGLHTGKIPAAPKPVEPNNLHDFTTHRDAWRNALTIALDMSRSFADRDYWKHEITAYDRAMAAFDAAPQPADERGAFPIIDVLAEWESENGTIAAITPEEWAALLKPVADAAIVQSPRQARAALSTAPQAREWDIEAAAQKLAECFDYPWAHMPEKGRNNMRLHAEAVVSAALKSANGGGV